MPLAQAGTLTTIIMASASQTARYQHSLSQFGEFVLDHDELDDILNEACRLVAQGLGVDLAKVVEIDRSSDTGLVRAGVGWKPGVVGKERIALSERSSEAFAVAKSEPVITRDISCEDRFEFPEFLLDHCVVAMVNVPILLSGRVPFGLLQVDSRHPRDFGEQDVQFLKTYAMMLGPAIERLKTASALKVADERLQLIENARAYVMVICDEDDRITAWLAGSEELLGWSPSEAIGQPISMIFTDEDRAAGVPARELQRMREDGTAADVRWHQRRDGSRVFLDGQTIAIRDQQGKQTGALKIAQDVTERMQTEAALRESEERLRQFGEASRDVLWMRDAQTLQWLYLTPAFEEIYGFSRDEALEGDNFGNWLGLILEEDRDKVLGAIEQVRRGEHVTFDYRIRRPHDAAIRWLRNTDFPITDSNGTITLIGGVGHDLTELHETELRLQVLVAELQHRTRNLMAVVLAASEKTYDSSSDLADFRHRFRHRLEALSRVQAVLSRLAEPDRVTFDQLLDSELEAVAGAENEVTADGPKGVRLRSSTVQTLAMALHELSTNSVKYGALSQPSARLSIHWALETGRKDGSPRLHIDWRETGVAMPADPSTSSQIGHGRELIERALPYQLDAKTTFAILPDGIHCTISLPVSSS